MTPYLVVHALLADEATYQALERAVLDDERVERDGHTVGEHVEEVVTRGASEAGLLVAIVEAFGVVEVDVVEGQLLHVDFTALASLRLTAEGEHGVGAAVPLLAVDGLVVHVVLADAADDAGTLTLSHVGGVGAQNEALAGDVVSVQVVGLAAFEHEGLAFRIVGILNEVAERRCERCCVVILRSGKHLGAALGFLIGDAETFGVGHQFVVVEQDGFAGLTVGARGTGVVLGIDGYGNAGVDDVDDIDGVGRQTVDDDIAAFAVFLRNLVTAPLLTNGRVGVVGRGRDGQNLVAQFSVVANVEVLVVGLHLVQVILVGDGSILSIA